MNQTFDPKISVSSGYSTIYLQTGHVRNQGVELSLGYRHTWRNESKALRQARLALGKTLPSLMS